MIPAIRGWLVAAALAGLAVLHTGAPGQAAEPPSDSAAPPTMQPSTESEADTLPAPTPESGPRQPAYVLPPPSWPTFDFSRPDPLLNRPNAAQPGWYTNVETNILFIHLRNQLGGPVPNTLTGNMDFVKFAGNPYNPTVSPRFEVGYRLADNWGSIQLGYRFLASRGTDQVTSGPEDNIQAPANQLGRVDFNMADLTYVSREFALGPYWNMRWGAGLRAMYFFFDSQLQFINPTSEEGAILKQTESNHLRAYGVWAFLDLERKMPIPGLALFGRLEGTDFYARTSEVYTETVAGAPGAAPLGFVNRFDGSVGPSILREVAGVSYTVPRWNYSRFMLGYQYETYFHIGRQSPPDGNVDTRGQLDLQGFFLRADFNF
jgi:hypothetical protein